MRTIFDRVTRLSIRFKVITILVTVAMMALGVYAALSLNIALLPPIDIPSTFVLARSQGSTSGDIMLQAYTIPMEEAAGDIEGVANIESTTTSGLVFVQFRNDFGLNQEQLRSDLLAAIGQIPLPTRTLDTAEGMSAQEMLGELPPDVVLYLYRVSAQNDLPFLSKLRQEVWEGFSEDVLSALPQEAYNGVAPQVLDALPIDVANNPTEADLAPQPETAPALPESWQQDGFATAADLVELTGNRDLGDLFNAFVEDGSISGPLGWVSDLTQDDIQWALDVSARCEAMNADAGENGNATCSMLSYLDGTALAAVYERFEDEALRDAIWQQYEQLGQEDQNAFAAGLLGDQVVTTSTESTVLDAPLPPEWKLEAPQLISFSLNDIPLAQLSVSAGEDSMSRDELLRLVETEIVPRLENLDPVADVSVRGGEQIRSDLLNEALVAEGLEPLSEASETSGDEAAADQTDEAAAEEASGEAASPAAGIPEGPALPASWGAFASQIPDVDEFDTADDLFKAGLPPSALLNQAMSMAEGNETIGQVIQNAFTQLSPEVLTFLAEHEEGFFQQLDPQVLNALPDETIAALPEDAQQQAERAAVPALGEAWTRLAAGGIENVADLAAVDGGPAATLNGLVSDAPDELRFFVTQLVGDLSPEALSYLDEQDGDFLTTLDPLVFCYMSRSALTTEPVQDVWTDQGWTCPRNGDEVELKAIAAGDVPTAAESLMQRDSGEERVTDPDAPALPASWAGIAGFVGAEELNTADDMFYTVSGGETQAPSDLLNNFAVNPDGRRYLQALSGDVLTYVADCEQGPLCEENFYANVSDTFLAQISDDAASALPQDVQQRRETVQLGRYEPEDVVTRINGNPSLILGLRKEGDANTVSAWSEVEEELDALQESHPEIIFTVAFEQASYIEESISGVAREGGLGAVMAVVVILLFLNFSVRSTLVTAVSIPTSVALAFVMMKWIPGNVHDVLAPLNEDAGGFIGGVLDFVLRLFPADLSLNIMTLSGMTVAIGRVVDDAIVVLENIYRNIQRGEDQLQAVLQGTRDVSVAIFAATVTTVVVFLPIGLFGGVIGAFFLPFGLAVTYALGASFVVAITVVPLFAYLFINKESLPEHHESGMERAYHSVIAWSLSHRWAVMAIATLVFAAGVILLGQLPTAFLPDFGEPTITITVDMTQQTDGQPTTIAQTDARVRRLENALAEFEGIDTIQTVVGGGGQESELIGTGGSVQPTTATLTLGVESQEALDAMLPDVRSTAEEIFSPETVSVSGASLTEQGFAGFAVVISGEEDNPPTLAELQSVNDEIIETLQSIEGITNVESSLDMISGAGGDVSQTYIRIDGIPAARYTAELETQDTLGLTSEAIAEVQTLDLPENLTVGQGFESELQTEGFQQTFVSMGIAVLIVYFVMVLTFGSLIHPITILFSLPLAVVGAAIGLAATGRVLGLSSVVGLLMLVGIVVTNAIVLIDRVQANRKEHDMSTREALINGGMTRLRPILMTAIATMVALLPLAIGLSEGAIIASELGTVVIGGLFSSTLLTLIVVPVVYSLFSQAQNKVLGKNDQEN